jgi:hypothetical protein
MKKKFDILWWLFWGGGGDGFGRLYRFFVVFYVLDFLMLLDQICWKYLSRTISCIKKCQNIKRNNKNMAVNTVECKLFPAKSLNNKHH